MTWRLLVGVLAPHGQMRAQTDVDADGWTLRGLRGRSVDDVWVPVVSAAKNVKKAPLRTDGIRTQDLLSCALNCC